MIKRTVIAAIISLFFVSYANAWEMDAYVEIQILEQTKTQLQQPKPTAIRKQSIRETILGTIA